MKENRGILVCGETLKDYLTSVTAELIHSGRRLCDELKEELSLVLLESVFQTAADEAISLGVDRVYVVEGPPLAETFPDETANRIALLSKKIDPSPSIILFGQTDLGREMAPRVGAKLGTSVCLDCVALDIERETGSLLQTKPVFGGNAMAVWSSAKQGPQIVSLRPGSTEPAVPIPSSEGNIIQVDLKIEETKSKGRLLATVQEDVKGVKLEEANVIVAGGGGIGGKDGFHLIEELAQCLHGVVGISRVPCDENWMPKSLEIGQTGHVVNPELYIAIGISGAPQHMAGCSDSKFIVAVNKDRDAHIFKEADFGIVGDFREALPAFIEKLKSFTASPEGNTYES
jgi:electron transfer flavoprotein alpha subunit